MTTLQVVHQASTGYVTVPLFDRNGAEAVPTSATYTIHDVDSGTVIKESAALTPAATLNITLTPDDNRMLNAAAQYELRRITVVAVYGVSDQLVVPYDYLVQRMPFLA